MTSHPFNQGTHKSPLWYLEVHDRIARTLIVSLKRDWTRRLPLNAWTIVYLAMHLHTLSSEFRLARHHQLLACCGELKLLALQVQNLCIFLDHDVHSSWQLGLDGSVWLQCSHWCSAASWVAEEGKEDSLKFKICVFSLTMICIVPGS